MCTRNILSIQQLASACTLVQQSSFQSKHLCGHHRQQAVGKQVHFSVNLAIFPVATTHHRGASLLHGP